MGYFYFDESIHPKEKFALGSFVYSETSLDSPVGNALMESGNEMTRDAIADELFPRLNEEPQDKANVVHVFIQIRKMLEHDNKPSKYWTLNFFCDWVAHPKLVGTGAQRLLKMLDDRLPSFQDKPEKWDPDGMVHNILSFHLLRRHLVEFLTANDLPTRWTEDDFTWNTVVRFYGQQVLDTPLVIDNRKPALAYVRRLEIVACEPSDHVVAANPEQKFYGFKWVVTLIDGRTFPWPYTSNLPERPANWSTQGIRARR